MSLTESFLQQPGTNPSACRKEFSNTWSSHAQNKNMTVIKTYNHLGILIKTTMTANPMMRRKTGAAVSSWKNTAPQIFSTVPFHSKRKTHTCTYAHVHTHVNKLHEKRKDMHRCMHRLHGKRKTPHTPHPQITRLSRVGMVMDGAQANFQPFQYKILNYKN